MVELLWTMFVFSQQWWRMMVSWFQVNGRQIGPHGWRRCPSLLLILCQLRQSCFWLNTINTHTCFLHHFALSLLLTLIPSSWFNLFCCCSLIHSNSIPDSAAVPGVSRKMWNFLTEVWPNSQSPRTRDSVICRRRQSLHLGLWQTNQILVSALIAVLVFWSQKWPHLNEGLEMVDDVLRVGLHLA